MTNEVTTPLPTDGGDILEALAAPFEIQDLKYKPGVVKDNRALAMIYVDARTIQDRLDDVLGVAGWQDEYEILPDGSVTCKLKVRVGNEWITKMDVGGPSEQPDEGDRRKAAFSDALKRAAVKFGVGRYLYRLPMNWCDYDPQKRKFLGFPKLPPWAMPMQKQAQPERLASATVVHGKALEHKPAGAPQTTIAAIAPSPANGGTPPPKTGNELLERLQLFERRLVDKALCDPGKLIAHILTWGQKKGEKGLIADWTGGVLMAAVEEGKAFKRYRQIQNEIARLRLQPADVDDLCNRNKVATLDVLARSEALSKIALDYLAGIKTPEPKTRPRSATARQVEELELEAERLTYTDAEILDTLQPYKAQTWADLNETEATELLAELRDAQPAAS